MSTPRTDGHKPSSTRALTRLVLEFAGFAILLFVTRFVARGDLVPQMDQECHIGGIAVEVLAHGIRFPLSVYAPNEYDNGSFFSGLLAAVSFLLLGRNVLALKLVTHLVSTAGAMATLWLLRGCLQELKLTGRTVRWIATATLLIAIALAPRVVTIASMYAIGNHTEGAAINTILLALFARRAHTCSAMRTAALWMLVGFALYLNKGTVLVIPVLAVAQIALAWRAPGRLAIAGGGFVLGVLPELWVVAQQYAGAGWGHVGWMTMASKADRNSHGFPRTFLTTLWFLGEYRVELLGAWVLSLFAGIAMLVRAWGERGRAASSDTGADGSDPSSTKTIPLTLAIVVGVSCLHLAELAVMARNGLDGYVMYGYPTLVVLYALLVASLCARALRRWGERTGAYAGAVAVVITLLLYRPYVTSWGFGKVSTLWQNHAGAACSWRFAEGFEREHDYGHAPPGQPRAQYAIEHCRLLSEPAQVLDCIGGIARELNWRQKGSTSGDPPVDLSENERRAYAYYHGLHRKGDRIPCDDFETPDLAALCLAAVDTECLVYGDLYTRIVSSPGLGPPRCNIREPPMDGYWAAMRADLYARPAGAPLSLARASGDDDLSACQPVYDACY